MTVPNNIEERNKMHLIDLTGQTFGRWTVIECRTAGGRNGGYLWLCRCDCGTEREVRQDALRQQKSKSCGCSRRITNDEGERKSTHPLFSTYRGMTRRCTSPDRGSAKYYHNRGIKVCDRWMESFWNFVEDMGERPKDMTLDRINPNGDYEPGNCRWATGLEQVQNRRPSWFTNPIYSEPIVFTYSEETYGNNRL